MDVLVALGTTIAYLFSIYAIIVNLANRSRLLDQFFETSIFLIFFILVGKTLEAYAKGKTTDAIQHLLTLTPDSAILVTFESKHPVSEQPIDINLVQVGDYLKVLPGARIPTDGKVHLGKSFVDESMLTGESLPVLKSDGDFVFAGTVNQSSVF